MELNLTTYPLPTPVTAALLDLAARSDILVLGELHGTREVPRLMLGLLDDLAARGYRGLALEVPRDQRDSIAHWAAENGDADAISSPPIPAFYARPGTDGRGNAETLALLREAVRRGWQPLCFDLTGDEIPADGDAYWIERDRRMAAYLAEQRERYCPDAKVFTVCGNLHSRLAPRPGEESARLWPSFAANLSTYCPTAVVSSIAIWFHRGTFYNSGQVNEMYDQGPLEEPEVRDGGPNQHTLALHLPEASAPTFLAPPAD